jgi:hypothetical protein
VPAAVVVPVCLFWCWWLGAKPAVGNAEFESPPDAEAKLIEQAIAEAQGVVATEAKPDGLAKRDAHPHAHGCVKAWFVVRSALEPRLRHGVFAEPGRVYPAWVRFSNGTQRDDTRPDGRGMAIKLMGVEGKKLLDDESDEPTQDFLMINHHTFFAANVEEYLDFFRHQRQGDDFGYFIGLNPLRWHLLELITGLGLLTKAVDDPLEAEYYSMLPFALGAHENIKFSAKPCDPAGSLDGCDERIAGVRGHGQNQAHPVQRSPHFLRDALVHSLAFEEGGDGSVLRADAQPAPGAALPRPAARFSFRVQLQKGGYAMPVEDASVTWSEDASPYVPVADVLIPYQRFDSAEQNHFCERLSFTPWHSLPAHQPRGGGKTPPPPWKKPKNHKTTPTTRNPPPNPPP